MKTPGDYALDWANGATWTELVAAIRLEAAAAKIIEILDAQEPGAES